MDLDFYVRVRTCKKRVSGKQPNLCCCSSCKTAIWYFLFLDSRGFLTSQGRSDSPRSSRYILKDYVNVSYICTKLGLYEQVDIIPELCSQVFEIFPFFQGKLLYCHPPPTVDAKDFQIAFTTEIKTVKKRPPTNSKTKNVSELYVTCFACNAR